ncbi:hypothetical protein D3C79_648440 [compost metagenome]
MLLYPRPSMSHERIPILKVIRANPGVMLSYGSIAKAAGLQKNRVRSVVDMMLVEGWIERHPIRKYEGYARYTYSLVEGVTIR